MNTAIRSQIRCLQVIMGLIGLNKGEMADLIGIHHTQLSHVFSGLRELSDARMESLADGLGLPYDVMAQLGMSADRLQHLDDEDRGVLGQAMVSLMTKSRRPRSLKSCRERIDNSMTTKLST